MTDKVQKIREEVARIQLYTQSEVLKQILDYIDEVQKEPVSEVWHDAQTEQPQAKKKIFATNEYGACEVDYAINMALYWPKVIKWAYIEDLLTLSNVERVVKNWEEPVSEDLEKAAKENAKIERSDDTEVGYDINRFGGFVDGADWEKEQLQNTSLNLDLKHRKEK